MIMMKKMAVLVSVENSSAAADVVKAAKEKLGLKKGARVLNKDGIRVLFVSQIIQKSMMELDGLDKHKDYDMLVIPCFNDEVKSFPKIHDIKVYMNNNLGFSIYICPVPKNPDEEKMAEVVENVRDVVAGNIGL
jgi:hypothetical protein